MTLRPVVSIATFALLLAGCPSEPEKNPSPPATNAPQSTAKGTGATKPAEAPKKGGGEQFGKGVIKATVKFSGTAPEMKVPKKRGEADFCKDTPVKYNAVLAADGKLRDVFVGIKDGQLQADYESETPVVMDQVSCMYVPRIAHALPEQPLSIKNSDPTLHNVNAGIGTETIFNNAQPKGAGPLDKKFEETGIYRMKCDVHSWMRAFIYVTDNPFGGVTGADGTATISKVPDGKYKVIAWHSQYGEKEQEVEVKGGEVPVEFTFDGKEPEPSANKGELTDLF